MAKSKGYIIAYIAAFIGIIVLLSPIAYFDNLFGESYIWIWGMYTLKPLLGETQFYFTENHDLLIWGLLATFLIFLINLILILTAKKAGRSKGKYRILWILCGIIFIAAPLVYFFGVSSEIPSWVSDLFWEIYSFHFAFYGSFIAGAFSIIAGLVS